MTGGRVLCERPVGRDLGRVSEIGRDEDERDKAVEEVGAILPTSLGFLHQPRSYPDL
jgi:hypothetical protein